MINLTKITKLSVMTAALPFIYGCGSGSGSGSLVGFLFGGGSGATGGEIALLGSSAGSATGGLLGATQGAAGVASLVNPEPATMLLVGGGLMAMSYFKSKNDRTK